MINWRSIGLVATILSGVMLGATPVDAGDSRVALLTGGQRIPVTLHPEMPHDLRKVATASRRHAFVDIVLPVILAVNETIAYDRQRLLSLNARMLGGGGLTQAETTWLLDLARRYKIDRDRHGRVHLDALIERVDIVPPTMALAQAALETGWGTSGHARDGQALFGHMTRNASAGRASGYAHERAAGLYVRSFPTLLASTEAYMRNLNTHYAYTEFRSRRLAMRKAGRHPDGTELARTMNPYCGCGPDYIDKLARVIEAGGLDRYDQARLIASGG
ncbi:MAG: glucosaminidase domain-containing protein [Erythrobacter sp.]